MPVSMTTMKLNVVPTRWYTSMRYNEPVHNVQEVTLYRNNSTPRAVDLNEVPMEVDRHHISTNSYQEVRAPFKPYASTISRCAPLRTTIGAPCPR